MLASRHPCALPLLLVAFAIPTIATAHPPVQRQYAPTRYATTYVHQYADYARQQRQLRAAIQIGKAEIKLLEKLQREYEPFTRFDTGAPLTVTVERVRIDLLAAKLHLRELKAQLYGWQRFGWLGVAGDVR